MLDRDTGAVIEKTVKHEGEAVVTSAWALQRVAVPWPMQEPVAIVQPPALDPCRTKKQSTASEQARRRNAADRHLLPI
jgi:hypothetical protein